MLIHTPATQDLGSCQGVSAISTAADVLVARWGPLPEPGLKRIRLHLRSQVGFESWFLGHFRGNEVSPF